MAGAELLLEGKAALITGGSRGIGAETVRLFRSAGARVAFSYRQAAEQARALERELDKGSGVRDQGSGEQGAGTGAQGVEGQAPGTGELAAEAPAEETMSHHTWGPQTAGFRGRPPANPAPRPLGGSGLGFREREGLGPARGGVWDTGTVRGTPLGRGLPSPAEAQESADGDAEELKTRPLANFYEDLSGTIRVFREDDIEVEPPQRTENAPRPAPGLAQNDSSAAARRDDLTYCVGIEQALETAADGRVLVEKAVAVLGRLDILVVNHGIWPPEDAPIATMTEAQWRRTMGVNLDAVFGLVQAAVAQFKRQREGTRDQGVGGVPGGDEQPAGVEAEPNLPTSAGATEVVPHQNNSPSSGEVVGHVVLISSTAGQRGEAFHADYAASKGALISLTKSLSSELGPKGIRVNCVAPGWVDTDMAAGTLEDPELGPKVRAQIPVGRPATPREIAGPVLFLCTPLAGFISGEVLNVNGGAVLVG